MTSSTMRIFLMLFTLAVMIVVGCKKKDKDDDTTPNGDGAPDPISNLLITGPDTLTFELLELDTFTISGGVIPYSILVQPDTSVAIVNIYGNLLVIEGNGIGNTDVKVGDTGGDSVWLNLTVTGPIGNFDWVSGTFTAFIDGVPYSGTLNKGQLNSEIIQITGEAAPLIIQFGAINVTGTGPYSIPISTASYTNTGDTTSYINTMAGTMFISIIQGINLKGTFNFTCVNQAFPFDSKTITGGIFDLFP